MSQIVKIVCFVFLIAIVSSCKGKKENKIVATDAPKVAFHFSEIGENGFPKSIGIINDYGEVFTQSQRIELSHILNEYNGNTTRQIVVVTIDSINPYTNIQKYATDLGSTWGVGAAEKNNGLTIVFCNPCKQIGIATGYGTELFLTDDICKNVIDSIMVPKFKNEEYYAGIKNGVTVLMEKWK